MSYIINKTNGVQLAEIVDGSIDQLSTNLTLVGRDYLNYGELLNENFVFLLENFANSNSPDKAIAGQLWFDTSINKLRVFNGQAYQDIGGTIASDTEPVTSVGDIWIDTIKKQLFFNSGSELTLGCPIYTEAQGKSGFVVEDVLDSFGVYKTVVCLYVSSVLIGIFSSILFETGQDIDGYGLSGSTINIGFNAGNLLGIKFYTPVTQADTLATGYDETAFVHTIGDVMSGTLSIQNGTPLLLGPSDNIEMSFNPTMFQISSNVVNLDFQIGMLDAGGLYPGIYIDASTRHVGIYQSVPLATLHVNGSEIVDGDLYVNNINGTSIVTTGSGQFDDIEISTNNIRFVNAVSLNGDIVLVPKGTGSVSVSNSQIKNVANPTDPTDAVNLQTLTTLRNNIGFSLDITGMSDADIAAMLNIILPPSDYPEGANCRLHCIDMSGGPRVRTNQISTIVGGSWSEPDLIP